MNNNKQNPIFDTENSTKYKIVDKNGKEIGVENTKHLAEMRMVSLPEELREGCNIIPITEDNKQLLFG